MSKNTSNFLKIVALVTMLIDHIGYIFFPHLIFLRIIGRIAFPLFAYLLVTGFIHTRNINNYLVRLGIFGIISQLPYHFFAPGRYNVILFFFIALLSLKYYDKKRIYIPIIAGLLTEYLKISYGMYGIVTIYLIYILYNQDIKRTMLAFTLMNIVYALVSHNVVQAYSVLALPFLLVKIKKENLQKVLSL